MGNTKKTPQHTQRGAGLYRLTRTFFQRRASRRESLAATDQADDQAFGRREVLLPGGRNPSQTLTPIKELSTDSGRHDANFSILGRPASGVLALPLPGVADRQHPIFEAVPKPNEGSFRLSCDCTIKERPLPWSFFHRGSVSSSVLLLLCKNKR